MQYLKLCSVILFSSFLLYSCSGNISANGAKDKSSAPDNSSKVNDAKSEASFSCKIDGKDFSGQGTDQMGNAAFVTSPGIINFVLVPIVAGQKGIPAQLSFHVADKGTTTIHGQIIQVILFVTPDPIQLIMITVVKK